jgi:hypothetical protein
VSANERFNLLGEPAWAVWCKMMRLLSDAVARINLVISSNCIAKITSRSPLPP